MLNGRRTAMPALQPASGFTLIELLVSIAIIAVLAALAAPSFTQAIANYRVRSGAETMLHGLNYTRAEAVRRNRNVTFTLSGTSGWDVVAPATGSASAVTIQQRPASESPGISATSSTASMSVTFLPTGLVDSSGTRLSEITVSSSAAGSDSRKINIFGGGLIRMCDPGISTANDPRRC
jgi:type IV fimbrial biogenesis protein FimT